MVATSRPQFVKSVRGVTPPPMKVQCTGFKPVAVESCMEGQHYVHPKLGPVLCKGVQPTKVPMIEDMVDMVCFEELNKRNPNIVRIDVKKIKESGIRQLTDEKTIDAVLAKLEAADGTGFFDKKSGTGAVKIYERIISSGNLNDLSELVSKTLGCTSLRKERKASTGMEYGDRAASLIAAEYALVKKVPYDAAYTLVIEKSGKNGRPVAKSAEVSLPEPQVLPQ